jgi:hypothetical protein
MLLPRHPWLFLAAFIFLIQSYIPHLGYPFCIPTQLSQAVWDWKKHHCVVHLARHVRHALLPITDSKPERILLDRWGLVKFPRRYPPPCTL